MEAYSSAPPAVGKWGGGCGVGFGRGRLEVEQAFSTYSPGAFTKSARLQAGHPLVSNMNEGTLRLEQT